MKFGMVVIFVFFANNEINLPPKKRKEKRMAPFFVFTLFPFSSPYIESKSFVSQNMLYSMYHLLKNDMWLLFFFLKLTEKLIVNES